MAVPPHRDVAPTVARRSALHRLESRQAQPLFRAINEQIVVVSDNFERAAHDLVCECTNPSCFRTFPITPAAYESVRLFPTRFIVRPGHVSVDSERVVEETPAYVVVEKFGPSAHSAIRLNPRRRPVATSGPTTSRGWNIAELRP
jgi:hypothetical protein